MTEPDVASSDATNIATRVVRDGDDYVINGKKWFITGAAHPRCSFLIVMGVTDSGADRTSRHSCIIVPMDVSGVRLVRRLRWMGCEDLRQIFRTEPMPSWSIANSPYLAAHPS